MQIVAAGLAQIFAAVRSLVTTGIQEGHMKCILNILNQLGRQAEKTKLTSISRKMQRHITQWSRL
jgi:hydroxymethylglutaryl-CoA reductase